MFSRTRVLAVALVVASSATREVRGDFILWNDEQLTVDSSHAEGALYDQSRADIVSGGRVTNLDAYDSSMVDMSDGWVYRLYTYDESIGDISGGEVVWLYTYGSSTVDISGGVVGSDHLRAYGSSTVNLSDGSVSGLGVFDTATANISGGSVSLVPANNSSTVNICGGSVGDLRPNDENTTYITGGLVDSLFTDDYCTVTLGAREFRFGSGLTLDGERLLGTGELSGEWFDGTRWTIDITGNPSSATILAVIGLPRGDMNRDGFVGGADLDIVRSFWGQTVTAGNLLHGGDPSGDGFVGGDDLDEVRAHWGEGTPPMAEVPEPSTLALLSMALFTYTWRKRRCR